MSSIISWNLQMSINDGHLDDFLSLMEEMVEFTKANEPNVLQYEIFLNDENTKCHVLESYKNADAAMIHIGNFGQHFAERFMTYLTIESFNVYGPATEDIKSALGPFGTSFYDKKAGFIN